MLQVCVHSTTIKTKLLMLIVISMVNITQIIFPFDVNNYTIFHIRLYNTTNSTTMDGNSGTSFGLKPR